MKIFENENRIIEISFFRPKLEGCYGAFFVKIRRFLFLWIMDIKPSARYINRGQHEKHRQIHTKRLWRWYDYFTRGGPMNEQQKKEILDSESYADYCTDNIKCANCAIGYAKDCSAEFYKIKFEAEKAKVERLKHIVTQYDPLKQIEEVECVWMMHEKDSAVQLFKNDKAKDLKEAGWKVVKVKIVEEQDENTSHTNVFSIMHRNNKRIRQRK